MAPVRYLTCALSVLAVLVLWTGCREPKTTKIQDDTDFGRRIFEPPPTGIVRALPPHNIHRNGVGPYALTASFQETLALLPSPRAERLEVRGLFDYRIMRTDNDALVLGVGRRNRLSFISVLDPDIAKTESGIGVGADMEELESSLGPIHTPRQSGHDARIVVFTSLPDTRFVVEKKKVVAAVVMPAREAFHPAVPAAQSCSLEEIKTLELQIRALAIKEWGQSEVQLHWGCVQSDKGEVIVQAGNTVAVIRKDDDSDALRVLSKLEIPFLDFIALLNIGSDRPEIFSITREKSKSEVDVVVTRYRLAVNKLTQTWTRRAFHFSQIAKSRLASEEGSVELLIEIRALDRAVELGGIYMERKNAKFKNVVPLSPKAFPLGRSVRKNVVPAEKVVGDAGVAPVVENLDATSK